MITLGEVQASLALFAEAMTGEPIVFVVADDADECWPASFRDPAGQITLPVELGSRSMYRSMLFHQLLTGPARDPHKASSSDPLVVAMADMAEDHRVMAETRRLYPGAVADLTELVQPQQLRTSTDGVASMADMVRSYTLGADRCLFVDSRSEEAALVNVVFDLLDQLTSERATTADSRRVASQICELIAGAAAGVSVADLVTGLDEDDDVAGMPTEATTGVTLDKGTPTEFVDRNAGSGGQLLSELDQDVSVADESDEAEDPAVSPEGGRFGRASAAPQLGRDRTFVYDEWDYHERRHRRAWCRVTEEHLVGDDHSFITVVRARHHGLRTRIRRNLMHMRPQDLVRVYRCDDGDEPDLDAAIEALADRRAGAPVDDRLQIRRDRAARDVATAFLIDLSASTSAPAVPPEPEPLPVGAGPFDDPMSYGPIWDSPAPREPVRRVIDVAKDAVALMGDALNELGDRFAIYGFSGTGRDGVEFKIGKNFDDRVTSAGWAAVEAMKPLRYTRMGPAVRHAAAKLAAEASRTKLLIVISDGYPQDTDYGQDRHDREYGLHDTARALEDATAAGIDTFCVTIDPAGHDYLRVMCPQDRYLVIDDVESLPEELARLYFLRLRS